MPVERRIPVEREGSTHAGADKYAHQRPTDDVSEDDARYSQIIQNQYVSSDLERLRALLPATLKRRVKNMRIKSNTMEDLIRPRETPKENWRAVSVLTHLTRQRCTECPGPMGFMLLPGITQLCLACVGWLHDGQLPQGRRLFSSAIFRHIRRIRQVLTGQDDRCMSPYRNLDAGSVNWNTQGSIARWVRTNADKISQSSQPSSLLRNRLAMKRAPTAKVARMGNTQDTTIIDVDCELSAGTYWRGSRYMLLVM